MIYFRCFIKTFFILEIAYLFLKSILKMFCVENLSSFKWRTSWGCVSDLAIIVVCRFCL